MIFLDNYCSNGKNKFLDINLILKDVVVPRDQFSCSNSNFQKSADFLLDKQADYTRFSPYKVKKKMKEKFFFRFWLPLSLGWSRIMLPLSLDWNMLTFAWLDYVCMLVWSFVARAYFRRASSTPSICRLFWVAFVLCQFVKNAEFVCIRLLNERRSIVQWKGSNKG